jgi:hypothetical protein
MMGMTARGWVSEASSLPSSQMGKGICADAASIAAIGLQNPGPMTLIAGRFLMEITVGANQA